MTTIRPSNSSSFPDKMVNPVFPPMSHSIGNGIRPPTFPPNVTPSNSSQVNASIFPPMMHTSNINPTQTPALANVLNTKINPAVSLPTPYNPTLQPPHLFSSNATSTPPLSNVYSTTMNSTPLAYVGNTNVNSSAPPLNTYNTSQISSLPTPPNIYSPVSNHPAIRPMYPTSSYLPHPQVSQQQSQAPSASYPNPQYNFNSNSAAAGHPGQSMPYGIGGNAVGTTNQQTNNNLNAPLSNNDMVDLLKEKSVINPFAEEPPMSPFLSEENQQMNCSPEVMRCSLNVIPQTKELLNKSRLPLGILIHPFKDLESLNVIQGTKIVRCDSCKSYINPFITFLDNTRWRCSICYRVNDLPQEFLFDPVTKTYGDPSRRPEVRFGTVEYTATADYMARPPQPAMYLFLLDVSHNAIQTGYLQSFCDILSECLNGLPGDARTKIGFITYDSRIHYYDLSDRQNGLFRVIIAPDLDSKPEDFLPMPDGLMVTLCECRLIVETFLNELPKIYQDNNETDSALGAALQIAGKLLDQTGGRITVVQTRIPNVNPGALHELISTGGHATKEPTIIGPTSDYYKKLSLDYASVQIACDLFLLNSHHIDLATLSCIAKYSGGEVKYYPGFHSVQKPHEVERFENDFRRYLQRKIGFEAVMRLRSPPAMAIQTFHGNGFVRSVDLLVLPNVNPDAAFGMQVTIEDSLAHYTSVTFQAALLYTSSKSERRIRVHTLSLPVSSNLTEICSNADQEAIISIIAKMAADRSMTSSIQEARDAMSNVACDILKACLSNNLSNRAFSLLVPYSLRLIPLYMLSMIKSTAFRAGGAPKVDDRAYYLDLCKTLPTQYLIQILYPDLYPIHTIEDKSQIIQDGEDELHIPQRVHLSYQNIDSHGAYILDSSEHIYVYIGKAISDHFVQNVFNVETFSALPLDSYSLPELENPLSMKIHNFLSYLIQSRPHGVAIHIMREDSSNRQLFTRHLIDDKSESTMSYVEFLRYIREQIVK
ncbi:unnamed protein product [Rotaria socialis]|uniref:Uncharacterized protein n=1 Tax=Rotaria socialis TaxID=392032 RepID=A0A817RAL9_9BILA|nr:unnamed protein product [Rotaria socialis]CAF3279037.1 unnamed protein product [Rotaria socialis]CAF3326005.1 unnamed protein product [Rotaria socialis]CAF4162593.1 unnamed protein product [Rotaria socialis]CAF4412018.1 unnamed protein product [Rotaria socialis]